MNRGTQRMKNSAYTECDLIVFKGGLSCRTCSVTAAPWALASLCLSSSFSALCPYAQLAFSLLSPQSLAPSKLPDHSPWRWFNLPASALNSRLYSYHGALFVFPLSVPEKMHTHTHILLFPSQPHPEKHNTRQLHANETSFLPSITAFVPKCLISDGVVNLRKMPPTVQMKEQQE